MIGYCATREIYIHIARLNDTGFVWKLPKIDLRATVSNLTRRIWQLAIQALTCCNLSYASLQFQTYFLAKFSERKKCAIHSIVCNLLELCSIIVTISRYD